ncbi:MAG: hypothetical protein ACOX7B_11825 [Christensenellales bacterium]|jgi:hypothetical protein
MGELFVGALQAFFARDKAEAEKLARQVLGWQTMPLMENFPAADILPVLRWLAKAMPPMRMRPIINGAWFEEKE